MTFTYGKQDMISIARAQESCFLLTNGLGGYASLSAAFSMTRADQGMLIAARTAPNDRVALVARIGETLRIGDRAVHLSTQQFADGTEEEDGYRRLSSLVIGEGAAWTYDVRGICVTREVAMAQGENASALMYTVENRSGEACELSVRPFFLGFPKGHAPTAPFDIAMTGRRIDANGQAVYLHADGEVIAEAPRFETPAFVHDAPDGRPKEGRIASVCRIALRVAPGERSTLSVVFSQSGEARCAREMIKAQGRRLRALRDASGLGDPVARTLAAAADAYIARRDSTGGKTIIAGYPFFGDWGRDTMIALPGCTLSTGRYDDAKSILRTFLRYEKDGLVPNLFPEGTQEPMYNTADAALLLINGIYLYAKKTGDHDFVREAWPVMARIVRAYQHGTHHGIRMDRDALICAGQGLDQVTWMDVRVGDILPTPRHGKPVEINAYWYNALKIMEEFAGLVGEDGAPYEKLAGRVKASFVRAFYMEEKGCLRDVVSGTDADGQIRCNQIWAVTMPFSMLSPEQERRVVDAVYAHLYTPCGLRTLSPDDPQYHPAYGGEQKERDMAYHQGTAWVFPLGAYHLAYLKSRGYTKEAARAVRAALAPVESMLREGCAGQLPEIYDGETPGPGRGCFAQAWSVGEMLRVYEKLEDIERG